MAVEKRDNDQISQALLMVLTQKIEEYNGGLGVFAISDIIYFLFKKSFYFQTKGYRISFFFYTNRDVSPRCG